MKRCARHSGHCLDGIANLKCHCLNDGASDVRASGAAGDAQDRAAGIRVPPRAAQAGKGRHDVDAARVGNAFRERADLFA